MNTIYNILIYLAQFGIKLASYFNAKLKLFVNGRATVFNVLKEADLRDKHVIWFHVASLGEYEQAVPLLKHLKTNYTNHHLLLSFFSPSGYEVKKNTDLADTVVYLPLDTPKNVRTFLNLSQPQLAVFIKYEIWPNYLTSLKSRNIPTVLASALFREDQVYFKTYGKFMRNALKNFDHIFVQNTHSKQLLNSIAITAVTVSGDTRYDRVSHQIEQDNRLDFIEQFVGDSLCVVCGSTWPEDDAILINFINKIVSSQDLNVTFIIAPHQIKEDKILALEKQLKGISVRYSQYTTKDLSKASIFIVDTIGLLTKIYSYADVAYVGGAMGNTGLHNILEPATFGVPVVIGQHFKNFPEATKLRELAGLFSVSNSTELDSIMTKLLIDARFRDKTGQIAGHFINSNTGATHIICSCIDQQLANNG